MVELAIVYFLCFIGALGIESRLPLDKLVERVLAVFTLGAGQLILAVQLLSLFDGLTGRGLFMASLVFAVVGLSLTLFLPASSVRPSWKILLVENWRAATGAHWPVLLLLAAGAGLISVYTLSGVFMFPFGDSYHYEKPVFWIQNNSIAPFAVPNPRINVTSFADDALALPGFLFGHSGLMLAVISLFSGILSLGVVFSLARRIGCTRRAAACASLLLPGFSIFAVAFLTLNADFYLAGMWAGASLIFLTECPGSPVPAPGGNRVRLGLSLACFLMACGAKNGTIVITPFYLVCLAMAVRRSIFDKRLVFTLAVSGALGAACSGTVWNYVENIRWYGSPQGPPFMRSLLSSDLNVRSVWTRMARDTTLMVYDVLYVPVSQRDGYGALCQKTVRLLGGKDRLIEDDVVGGLDFDRARISPRAGFGLVGILFILPALVAAWRWMRGRGDPAPAATPVQRRNLAILLICGFGCFLVCHILLRWQSIGLWRLMPVVPVIAAALCGLVLSKSRYQLVLLLATGCSAAVFLTFDAGMIARRCEWMGDNWLLKKLSASATQHGCTYELQWVHEPLQVVPSQEDYLCIEAQRKFVERVDRGATIAFAGTANSPIYRLFGADFSNRVIPLNDARDVARWFPPPAGAKYLVIEQDQNIEAEKIAWATNRGYALIFQGFREPSQDFRATNCIFAGFAAKP